MTLSTVDLCRTCDQPFCTECDDDATQCADGGWHCSACGWADCGRCRDDAVREQRAEQAREACT